MATGGIFMALLPLLILAILIGGGVILAVTLASKSKPCPHCGATKEHWKTAASAPADAPKCPACGIPLAA